MRRHVIAASVGMMVIAVLFTPARAVNLGPDPLTPSQIKVELSKVQSVISEENFQTAILMLKAIIQNNPRTANAYNLLGFSYRKTKDFKRAERNYKRALRLDPEHKGALEYMGELFLETDRREKAEDLLARLEKLCPNGCEELEDLREAFAGEQTSSRNW